MDDQKLASLAPSTRPSPATATPATPAKTPATAQSTLVDADQSVEHAAPGFTRDSAPMNQHDSVYSPAEPPVPPAEPPNRPDGPSDEPTPGNGPTVLSPRFVGTGGDYFGIWIVNLLLLIVTLGLYFPWARVRKLQFFAGNTDVGGHRLQFTGVARQMFLGFSLAMVAFIAYYVAEAFAPELSLVIIGAFALIWPWIFRAALRFRLAKTEWRGLPFAFVGTTRGAYKTILPFYLLMLVGISVGVAASLFGTASVGDASFDTDSPMIALLGGFVGIAILAAVLIGPWLQFRIKRYQHDHYRFADRQSRFTATVGAFYLLFIKTLGVLVVALIALGLFASTVAAVFIGVDSIGALADMGDTLEDSPLLIGVGVTMAAIGLFLAWQAVTAYFVRTLHNLTWGNTAGNGFAFAANLKFWPFFGLRVLNLVLKSLTLGLYTPFAQVAIVKMKLDSVVLAVDFDLEALVTQAQDGKLSAGADAAADLFDLDIAL
ncbi:MAG: YjgN family protein [Burkholderiaceae bacterium]